MLQTMERSKKESSKIYSRENKLYAGDERKLKMLSMNKEGRKMQNEVDMIEDCLIRYII